MSVEDRFNDCFVDFSAEWIDQFVDSLNVFGAGRDGEPFSCLANMIESYRAYVVDDSLRFFSYSEAALDQARRLGVNSLYFNLLTNQVSYYCMHHNTFKAQKLAESLIEEAKETHDRQGVFNGYLSLGLVQSATSHNKQAINSYTTALNYVDEDKMVRAQLLYEIGTEYYMLDKYDTALDYLNQAIDIFPEVENAKLFQALCYFKLKDYSNFRTAFTNLDKESLESDQFHYIKAADYALKREYSAALSESDKIEGESDRNLAKSDIYGLMNMWDKALEHYRIANAAIDSVRQDSFTDLLVSAYGEIDIANQLRAKDEEVRKNRMYVTISIFASLLLLIIFIAAQLLNRQHSKWQKYRLQITQKHNAELTEAKEKAEEANRLKTRFLQNMSHDLRSPLNAIVGFSQLLGLPDGFNSEEDKEKYNSYIANNSEMLMLLFEDILDVEDIEKGNYQLINSLTPCNELCRKVMMCVEYRVPAGVELKFNSNVDDSFSFNTDGRRIQQVLMNFLTNACKHTLNGEIRLSVNVDTANNTVTFSVADTGEGVREDMQDSIFERYVKTETADSHGIGLSICTSIADKMGGTVALDKNYTGGAKFDFTLNLS